MRVLVSGSTGLVGSAVVGELRNSEDEIVRLVRKSTDFGEGEPAQEPADEQVQWDPESGELDAAGLEGLDAVVHLAGQNIAAGRWNADMKRRISESRVEGTKLLCETLASLDNKPKVLVCASAIGIYGDRGEAILDESSEPSDSFLANVCRDWESATKPAREAGIRVVLLRSGVVISSQRGALEKMLKPFRFCVGGVVGGGQQWWSWIALDDVAGVVRFAIENESLAGPVNTVSPNAVTNRDFTKTLGRALFRPTILPLPAFVVRALMGEMGKELLLASTLVVPKKLQTAGYKYECPTLKTALKRALDGA